MGFLEDDPHDGLVPIDLFRMYQALHSQWPDTSRLKERTAIGTHYSCLNSGAWPNCSWQAIVQI